MQSSCLLSYQQLALVSLGEASHATIMQVHKDSSYPLADQQLSLCDGAITFSIVFPYSQFGGSRQGDLEMFKFVVSFFLDI